MANVCIIPARGGSKRIPKKNIKIFHGKPLIAYSIELAKNSKLFDDIYVSTDSKEIAEVSVKYGAKVHKRPKELADDFTGTSDVVKYVLDELKKDGMVYEYCCTLYATAPLLQEEYLKKGYIILKNSTACASFGATSFSFPIQRAFKIKDNRCQMFDKSNFIKRSQDLEEAYHDAGQFYWKKVDCNINDIFFGEDSIPIILPRYLVQDIDTLEDWMYAEYMYEVIKRKGNK